MRLAWQHWLYGLLWATISGAATSGVAWLGMAGAHGAGIDVPQLNWKALGVILASGAVTNFLSFLKQTPLPKEEDEKPTTT